MRRAASEKPLRWYPGSTTRRSKISTDRGKQKAKRQIAAARKAEKMQRSSMEEARMTKSGIR